MTEKQVKRMFVMVYNGTLDPYDCMKRLHKDRSLCKKTLFKCIATPKGLSWPDEYKQWHRTNKAVLGWNILCKKCYTKKWDKMRYKLIRKEAAMKTL